MGNYQSTPSPLPNPEKLIKIVNLRSKLERTKMTLMMDETGLTNELANNPPESHDQIRNKFNFIEDKKKYINTLEKELDSLSNEKFTQVSNIPQNGHSQGCKTNKEDFIPFPNIMNQLQNTMKQPQKMTQKDYLNMEIDKNKNLINDNLKIINFFRQNPMFAQNPQIFEQLILPQRNQIMMYQNTLNELYARLEQLNKEGFSQVEPDSRDSYNRHPNLINKKNSITKEELSNARKNWGDALIAISVANDQKGLPTATQVAKRVIDGEYGYNLGPVLFKPTLTSGDHTFRTTRDGALAYFVGQNPKFPNDNGFALKGWRKADIETAAEFIDGDVAMWMGIVTLTDKNGNKVKVDKSWGYKKGPDGKLRIVLHHSSLPYLP